MEQIDVGLIDAFAKRQKIQKLDRTTQIDVMIEEVAELVVAYLFENKQRELEEVVDVLITVLIYFKVIGASWKEVVTEFERKMKVNLNKPVRDRIGVKVKKE